MECFEKLTLFVITSRQRKLLKHRLQQYKYTYIKYNYYRLQRVQGWLKCLRCSMFGWFHFVSSKRKSYLIQCNIKLLLLLGSCFFGIIMNTVFGSCNMNVNSLIFQYTSHSVWWMLKFASFLIAMKISFGMNYR